ncbi:hypothetical protein PGB90_001221 [Kerria lacca]
MSSREESIFKINDRKSIFEYYSQEIFRTFDKKGRFSSNRIGKLSVILNTSNFSSVK